MIHVFAVFKIRLFSLRENSVDEEKRGRKLEISAGLGHWSIQFVLVADHDGVCA